MTITIEPATFTITQPGVYPDVSESVYHRDPVVGGSLSSTGARTLVTRTPAHFEHERRHGRPDKKEFDLGRVAHDMLLGGGAPLVEVDAPDWRTKAAKEQAAEAREAGASPLLVREADEARAMVAAVRAHPRAGKLFARDGRAELTLVHRDPTSGVMCRVRVDWLPDTRPDRPVLFVDFKTAASAHPAKLARSMGDWGYHQQLPFYEDAVAATVADGRPVTSVLVAVEKTPPYLVTIAEPDEQAVAWGRVLNAKARDLYRTCTDTGTWPGYGDDTVPLSLPGYQLAAYEAARDAGAYDLSTRATNGDHP